MNEAKYTSKKLLWEGFLYSIVWVIINFIINAFLQPIVVFAFTSKDADKQSFANVVFFIIFLSISWVATSAVFAKFKPESDFDTDFRRFLGVGFLNHIIIALTFLSFTIFVHETAFGEAMEALFDTVFMQLWNFFSGGSSNFGIAVLSFFPAIIVFILFLMVILFITFFMINTLSYIFTKPLADKMIDRWKEKKS